MRLRCRMGPDEAFDGLTAEDIRRIRALDTVPAAGRIRRAAPEPTRDAEPDVTTPRKRGRRA